MPTLSNLTSGPDLADQSLRSSAGEKLTSLVILTYQRNYLMERQLAAIETWKDALLEVIVVDNAGDPPASQVCDKYPWVKLVRAPRNMGAAGRNLGFEAALGAYVITIDDDVVDLKPEHVHRLEAMFNEHDIGAINFKVVEEHTGRLMNWVHHRRSEVFANQQFETYEITEGAVALRKLALDKAGGYPEEFFLSHEGPDLAYRLMNDGWKVIYSPAITVTHLFAPEGRASWRKYYFDTRNTLWLVLRNLPYLYGAKIIFKQNLGMAYYAARDGFFRIWLKAWVDALKGARAQLKLRRKLSRRAMYKIHAIDKYTPSIASQIVRRLSAPAGKLGTNG